MKSIALICFDNPFKKPMEGGKRGMLSRIKALAECPQYHVDVYLLTKPTEVSNQQNDLIESNNIRYYNFTILPGKKVLFSKYPLSVAKRFIPECRKELSKHTYDVAIYEGEHVSEYRVENCIKAKKHVLYMHDIESIYRADLCKSETNNIKKIAQQVESKKYYKLEEKLPALFDIFLFVSADEKNQFERRFSTLKVKCIYTPYATDDFANTIVINNCNNKLLYIGNLQLKNNYLSILWFVKNVMPIILKKKSDTTLTIIGNISEENKKELTEICNNVKVLGYVPDLNEEIKEACCIISPVLFGAGVKVKLIDALASGQIVIANKKAAEGTELVSNKHLLLVNSEQEYADACLKVLNDRSKYTMIASQGLDFVKQEHSVAHHRDLLIKAIEE